MVSFENLIQWQDLTILVEIANKIDKTARIANIASAPCIDFILALYWLYFDKIAILNMSEHVCTGISESIAIFQT